MNINDDKVYIEKKLEETKDKEQKKEQGLEVGIKKECEIDDDGNKQADLQKDPENNVVAINLNVTKTVEENDNITPKSIFSSNKPEKLIKTNFEKNQPNNFLETPGRSKGGNTYNNSFSPQCDTYDMVITNSGLKDRDSPTKSPNKGSYSLYSIDKGGKRNTKKKGQENIDKEKISSSPHHKKITRQDQCDNGLALKTRSAVLDDNPPNFLSETPDLTPSNIARTKKFTYNTKKMIEGNCGDSPNVKHNKIIRVGKQKKKFTDIYNEFDDNNANRKYELKIDDLSEDNDNQQNILDRPYPSNISTGKPKSNNQSVYRHEDKGSPLRRKIKNLSPLKLVIQKRGLSKSPVNRNRKDESRINPIRLERQSISPNRKNTPKGERNRSTRFDVSPLKPNKLETRNNNFKQLIADSCAEINSPSSAIKKDEMKKYSMLQ